MTVDFGAFLDNLYYMGVGMLCIFLVILVLILSVYALDKISAVLEKKNGSGDGAQNR